MSFARRSCLTAVALSSGLLFPARSDAQVELGLRAGVSIASWHGDNSEVDPFGSRTGFLLGAQIGIPFEDGVSVAPGLYWMQKGARVEEGDASLDIVLDYVEVPVVVALRVTTPERPVGLSLFIGPSLAFEIGCSAHLKQGGTETSGDCAAEEDQGVLARRQVDFGSIMGAGVRFPFSGNIEGTIDGGLDLGLRSRDRNTMWFLMAGAAFRLGG